MLFPYIDGCGLQDVCVPLPFMLPTYAKLQVTVLTLWRFLGKVSHGEGRATLGGQAEL